MLDQLNARLHGELADDSFVTAACFELSATYGLLTVANAGHVPLFLRRADSGRVVRVGTASGPPLGMLPNVRYSSQAIHSRPKTSSFWSRTACSKRSTTSH